MRLSFPSPMAQQRQTFLHTLYAGKRELSLHEAQQRAEHLGLEWLRPPLVVAAIAPYYTDVPAQEKDDLLLRYHAFILEQLDAAGYLGCCLIDSGERFVVILSLHEEYKHPHELDEFFISVHDSLHQHFGHELFIGIGSVVDALNKVDTSYMDAAEMLAYKFQYASRGVINITNITRFEHTLCQQPHHDRPGHRLFSGWRSGQDVRAAGRAH